VVITERNEKLYKNQVRSKEGSLQKNPNQLLPMSRPAFGVLDTSWDIPVVSVAGTQKIVGSTRGHEKKRPNLFRIDLQCSGDPRCT
jgi:hypothetical protein